MLVSESDNQLSIDISIIKQKLSELIIFESNSSKTEEIILELKHILFKYYPTNINQVIDNITEFLKQLSSHNREKILAILQEHVYLVPDFANFLANIRNNIDMSNGPSGLGGEKEGSTEISANVPIITYDELTESEKENEKVLLSTDETPEEPPVPKTKKQGSVPALEKSSQPTIKTETKLPLNETPAQKNISGHVSISTFFFLMLRREM